MANNLPSATHIYKEDNLNEAQEKIFNEVLEVRAFL